MAVSSPRGPLLAWVRYRGRDLKLTGFETVIGRSASCQIVLDDGLVSRRHAQITLEDDRVVVHDLGSVNGVYINGVRLEGSKEVTDGDRILIGKQELMVRTARAGGVNSATLAEHRDRSAAETLTGLEPAPFAVVPPTTGEPSGDTEATRKGDAFDLLGGVADKVLAMGRGAEAERILSNYLRNLLASQRRGGMEANPVVIEKATSYAIKLARATGKGSWVDYAIELNQLCQKPLPGVIVEELYQFVRQVDIDLKLLREYVAVLKAKEHGLGPAERFIVQRIEGLERLVAAR